MEFDVPRTFGALLIGGLFSSLVSGMVLIQAIVYFKTYDGDPTMTKILVLFVWFLDLLHTALMWGGLWTILIGYFGQALRIDILPGTISSTVVVTGILAFIVHCFLSYRIFTLSKKGWFLAGPIIFFALLRLACVAAITAELVKLDKFTLFRAQFDWLFTLGFVLSSVIDTTITCSLLFLLNKSQMSSFSLGGIIDTAIHYTLETGSLTAAGTFVLMVCWLAMPQNFVFIGLHLIVAKFYAHTLLATLNTRPDIQQVRPTATRTQLEPIQFAVPAARRNLGSTDSIPMSKPIRSQKVTFSTERLLQR